MENFRRSKWSHESHLQFYTFRITSEPINQLYKLQLSRKNVTNETSELLVMSGPLDVIAVALWSYKIT